MLTSRPGFTQRHRAAHHADTRARTWLPAGKGPGEQGLPPCPCLSLPCLCCLCHGPVDSRSTSLGRTMEAPVPPQGHAGCLSCRREPPHPDSCLPTGVLESRSRSKGQHQEATCSGRARPAATQQGGVLCGRGPGTHRGPSSTLPGFLWLGRGHTRPPCLVTKAPLQLSRAPTADSQAAPTPPGTSSASYSGLTRSSSVGPFKTQLVGAVLLYANFPELTWCPCGLPVVKDYVEA